MAKANDIRISRMNRRRSMGIPRRHIHILKRDRKPRKGTTIRAQLPKDRTTIHKREQI